MNADAILDYAIPEMARLRLRLGAAGRLRTALVNSKFAALAAPLPAGQMPDLEMAIGPFTPVLPPECLVIDKDFSIAPQLPVVPRRARVGRHGDYRPGRRPRPSSPCALRRVSHRPVEPRPARH